jgi:hypothetical protein
MSGCHPTETLALCEHQVPIKFGCIRCERDGILKRIEDLENRFATIDHLIKASNTAESLFAQKVHDLKFIDQKRDDVINALCQKVEAIDVRLDVFTKCLEASNRS